MAHPSAQKRGSNTLSSYAELLNEGGAALQVASPSPRLDAALLLAYAAGFTRVQLIVRSKDPAAADVVALYRALIARRSQSEPVAYITAEKEFWGLPFKVTPAVLIPRPETELLVEQALEIIDERQDVSILELGTGSGCIPVALVRELTKQKNSFVCTAVDSSAEALHVAEENASRHKVTAKIKFVPSDWFSALAPDQLFDLIISNPPYIADTDTNVSPETRFEPNQALYSGAEGLDAIKKILLEAPLHLCPEGDVLIEIGSGQQQALEEFYQQNLVNTYRSITFLPDLAGRVRVLWVKR